MVLTVTINPILEKRIVLNSFKIGETYRINNEFFTAGGKGINVSRQLNLLGIENIGLTFLGGNNGKVLRRLIENEGISISAIHTKNETRTSTIVINEKDRNATSFISNGVEISSEEVELFKEKLEKMILNASTVVFSGGSPCKETDSIFPFGIETAIKNDKTVVLDTYGNHLSECLKFSPTIFHVNKHEIESSLSIKLDSESDYSNFFESCNNNRTGLVFITDGPNKFYSSKFNFKYRITPPSIISFDPTGSGDAFTAGIVYGVEKALIFDDFTKLAVALGALNASSCQTCNVKLSDAEKYYSEVNVNPIGKKMKLIDDTPTF